LLLNPSWNACQPNIKKIEFFELKKKKNNTEAQGTSHQPQHNKIEAFLMKKKKH
jgi:hypothetical protein